MLDAFPDFPKVRPVMVFGKLKLVIGNEIAFVKLVPKGSTVIAPDV
jgi:hypothetical protein